MTPIYHGINNKHWFHQSEDKSLLILRNFSENTWSAHRDFGFVGFFTNQFDAAKALNANLDDSKEWKQMGAGWQLVPIERTYNV